MCCARPHESLFVGLTLEDQWRPCCIYRLELTIQVTHSSDVGVPRVTATISPVSRVHTRTHCGLFRSRFAVVFKRTGDSITTQKYDSPYKQASDSRSPAQQEICLLSLVAPPILYHYITISDS